jgi:hypothetical protein
MFLEIQGLNLSEVSIYKLGRTRGRQLPLLLRLNHTFEYPGILRSRGRA